MFTYVLKQLRRSAVTNALFCLLLTLSGTLLCISAGLWYSAHKALLDIDETITTIMIPDRIAISRLANERIDENPLLLREENIHERAAAIFDVEQEIFQTIREDIYPSGILKMDERRIFGAIADGIAPIEMRLTGVGAEPHLAVYSGQSIAAFVVTCEMIDTEHWIANNPDWTIGLGEDDKAYIQRFSSARFTVDELLRFNPAFIPPRYVSISFLKNHDGSTPFEVGKQYVVLGTYERRFGIGTLAIESPSVEIKSDVVDRVYSNEEMHALVRSLVHVHLADNLYPMDVIEYSYEREFRDDDGWYSFLEIEGSLEETKTSERWVPMKEALESAEISAKSFQVLTTNDPNSLFRFNQNRNLFDEGRTFSSEEVEEGALVCLVSRQFAELNELEVGDTVSLQMYATELSAITMTYLATEDGNYVTNTFWIPSLYNASLEISQPTEFSIVGIYNTLRADRSEHAILPNTVIIPDNSFGTVEGEPVSLFDTTFRAPLLSDSMILPNGRIQETRDAINEIADGYGGLFRYYDQGYDSLRLALGNLRFGMTWILVLSAASWAAVLLIFLMFYVLRKRKEAALLYAIGVSRTKRFSWIFAQCAFLILLSLGISIAVSLPLYGDILDIAAGTAQAFTDSFRDLTLSDAADAGLRSRIPLDRSPIALIITVAGATVLTLVSAGLLSSHSTKFKSLSEKRGDD